MVGLSHWTLPTSPFLLLVRSQRISVWPR